MIRRLLIALVLIGISAQAQASSNGILTQGLSSSTSSPGGSTSLSALTSATGSNSFDNAAFPQTWTWNSLSTQTALSFTSSTLTTGTVLSLSAPNATTGQALTLTPQLSVTNGGTGVNSNTLAQSFDYAPRATLLPRWTAALNRVRSGKGNASIVGLGDSQTAGQYATTDGTQLSTSNYLYDYSAHLMGYFQSAGLSAFKDGIYGGDSSNGTRPAEDARIALTGNFAAGGSCNTGPTLGGVYFCASSAGTVTYTPSHQVNSFTIWYGTCPSGCGTFSYQIDGGSATNVNTTTGSLTNASVTITPALGTHTLTINYVSGTAVYIDGVDAANTSLSASTGAGYIDFAQAGVSGIKACSVSTQTGTQNALGVIQSLAPDLVILELGQNDLIQGSSVATTGACLQSIITTLSPTMDIVLINQIPLPTTGSTNLAQSTQNAWSAKVKALGAANNIPVVNIFDAWGGAWTTLSSFDFYGSSTAGSNGSLHPGPNGYPTYGQDIYYVVGGAGNSSGLTTTSLTVNGPITATGLSGGTVALNSYVGLNSSNQMVLGSGGGGSGSFTPVLQPLSVTTTDTAGNEFPYTYFDGTTTGAPALGAPSWGTAASLGADTSLRWRFKMPPSLPASGTLNLCTVCQANATSGVVKYTVSDADVAVNNTASVGATALNSETQTSITWSNADDYVQTCTPLTETPTADHISAGAVTFNHTSWTLAQILSCNIFEEWK